MEQQLKQELKQVRLDFEKWFEKVDSEIKEKAKQQNDICFVCNQEMDIKEAHLVNFDNIDVALICWKCYERNIEEFLINERGED